MNVQQALQIKADRTGSWRVWFRGLGIPEDALGSLGALRAYLEVALASEALTEALDALCQEWNGEDYTDPAQVVAVSDALKLVKLSRENLDGGVSEDFQTFAAWMPSWAFDTGTLAGVLGSRYKVGMYGPRITDLTDVLTGGYGLEVSGSLAEETWTSLSSTPLPNPSALYELVYGCVSPAQYLLTEIESFGYSVSEETGAFGFYSNPGKAVEATDALIGAWTPEEE